MALRRKEGVLLVLAGVCVALFVADQIVVGPLIDAWKARAARLAELGEMVSQGESLIEREETYRAAYDRMISERLSVEGSAAEIQVLEALQRWTEESGLRLSSYKPRYIEGDEEERPRLECQTRGDGSMENIARFLYAIESDPLAVRLENVEIAASDERGQDLDVQVRFSSLLKAEEVAP